MKHAAFKIFVLNYLWIYNSMFNNDWSSCWSLLSETWMIRLESSLMRQVGSEIGLPIFICHVPDVFMLLLLLRRESAYLLVCFASVLPIVLPGCSAGLLPLLIPTAYVFFSWQFLLLECLLLATAPTCLCPVCSHTLLKFCLAMQSQCWKMHACIWV